MIVSRRTLLAVGGMSAMSALTALAACSSSSDPQPASTASVDADSLRSLAADLMQDMVAGEYGSTVDIEDDAIKATLDEAALRSAWEQATADKGAFSQIDGTAASAVDDSTVVIVVASFANGQMTTQYSFTAEKTINGLYLRNSTPDDLAQIGAAGTSASAATPATGEHSVDHPVQVGRYQLDGTLVTPAEGITAQQVVVLLVAGSGPQDMDETVGAASNKPLRDLADALAGEGISSLRYNKRFQQHPESAGEDWTLAAEVLEDVTAATELLRSRKEVSGYRIVVAGHSLGGMLLPRILASDGQLAGGVSLAGSPRSFFDIVFDQGSARIAASGDSSSDQDAQVTSLRQQTDEAKALTDPSGEPVLDMPASYVVDLNTVHDSVATDIAAVDVPWLILQGGDDAQVFPDKDYPAWQEALAGRDAECQLFDGLNHLFMSTGRADGPLDYDTPNTVSPEVGQAIASWITTHVS